MAEFAPAAGESEVVAVNNEVGNGIVPDNQVGRSFRDVQELANQLLARQAVYVVLMLERQRREKPLMPMIYRLQSKSVSSMLLVAMLLGMLVACNGKLGQQATKEEHKERGPARIVSLSPSVTEILYGVGAWPQVVAVSQFCSYPADVANKPRVDGWANTNLEQVTTLKPDLVIGVDAQASFVGDKLKGIGLRSLFVKSQSLADVFNSIGEIGRAVGHEREGNELATQTQREIDIIRRTLADRQHPRVLCIVDRVPGTLRELYTATHGSYLDDLISVAGGQSIAPSSAEGYGKITKEAVISLNPEVIIDIVPETKGNIGEDPMAVWRELSEVSAVREGRVYFVRDPIVVHPSQFVSYTAQLFASLIHPEVFPNAPEKPR